MPNHTFVDMETIVSISMCVCIRALDVSESVCSNVCTYVYVCIFVYTWFYLFACAHIPNTTILLTYTYTYTYT